MIVRYRICNLACPYCITQRVRKDLFDIDVFRAILDRIQQLPRRICLHLGVEGEIFTSQDILDEVRTLCNRSNNLLGVSFLSNIQASWERVIDPFLRSLDTSRLGIGCTLHDLVVPDIDGFFQRVEAIREHGVAVYVTHVALPGRINKLIEYRERCRRIGVTLAPNALIGSVQGVPGVNSGSIYPRDYTAAEVDQMREVWDTPHSFKMLVEACPPRGMECAAGRGYALVNPVGEVFPCSKIQQSLGNLLHGAVGFRERDMVCPSDRCWCGNQNQALRIVDRYYCRTRNTRLFYAKRGMAQTTLYEGYSPPLFNHGSPE